MTQCLVPSPAAGRTALREWLVFAPEMKESLLESPQETWPAAIAAAVEATGNTLAAAARSAFAAGGISGRDLARLEAANPS